MRKLAALPLLSATSLLAAFAFARSPSPPPESPAQRDARMSWWRDARFGMFIHFGLYSIPGGEWAGKTDHAEWIRTTAQIPLDEYDKLRARFNPVAFNAVEWASRARRAGMRYLVITSKHHDGFCMFDAKATDFDVMNTPFRRDVMKEIVEGCRREGVVPCFYHSIMDWHHPDYLPRRDWEKDRSTEGAQFDRFVSYLQSDVTDLLTNYGKIGVLWFDGEWENTWSHDWAKQLNDTCRSLQPDLIINNRVDVTRGGMAGLSTGENFGDFGTPEQEIPATGLPGVDWETCMTMNDNWGWNSHDTHWKSSQDLVRKLCDIASKGGNFLLNIGPRGDGSFPPEAIARLDEIGRWMDVNGDAIHGTSASPIAAPPWGRITVKDTGDARRYFLHVFDWPADGKLVVPGLAGTLRRAWRLGRADQSLATSSDAAGVTITVEGDADALATVIALDVAR